MTDEALLQKLDSIIDISKRLPIIGSVQSITNASNERYSLSSAMIIQFTTELLDYRNKIAMELESHEFDVEANELAVFVPHITIRLGVPLEGNSLRKAEALFINRKVTFRDWLIFRVVKQNDTRIMHEVWPDHTS